jgi:hypothetical protein
MKTHYTEKISEEDKILFHAIFPKNQEAFAINGEVYNYEQGLIVIKKIIIYLIMILDNLNLFVHLKTGGKIHYNSLISEKVSFYNRNIIKYKIKDKKEYKNECFQVDTSLLDLSIKGLVNKIKIKDILSFLKVSQINFLVKDPNKKKVPNGFRERNVFFKNKSHIHSNDTIIVNSEIQEVKSEIKDLDSNKPLVSQKNLDTHINDNPQQSERVLENGKWIPVTIFEYEIDEIILAKRKRPDEELKHSFKAVRKGIEKNYKLNFMRDSKQSKLDTHDIRNHFNANVLQNNAKYIGNFKQSNITKEVVADLKKCDIFMEYMNDYIQSYFIKDEIENNVLNKKEEIMNESLCLKEFLLALMTKQKKNGWIVQNILNSLDVLENCCDDTILKRKGKRKTRVKPIKKTNDSPKLVKKEKGNGVKQNKKTTPRVVLSIPSFNNPISSGSTPNYGNNTNEVKKAKK